MFLHSIFHRGRFDGLLVELKVTGEVEDGNVFNSKDLVFVCWMVHAGVSVEVLLLLNAVELLDNLQVELLMQLLLEE